MKKVPIYQRGEVGALSLIVNDPEILNIQVWKAEYFAIDSHRKAFEAMLAIHQRTGDLNEFTAISELERMGELERLGGETFFLDLFQAHVIVEFDIAKEMAEDYRKELIRFKSYRDAIKLWEENEEDIRGGRANLQTIADSILSSQVEHSHPTTSTKDIAMDLVKQMEGSDVRTCYSTGLIYLDRTMKGGMHSGELLTVAAESGGGKSIFMVQAALANIMDNKSVVIFSLEMDKTDIFSRLVSCHSGMPVRTHDEYRTIHARELPAITPAILELQKKSITIVDDLVSLEEIIAEAKRLNSLGKADVVIVDYLQIVENESDNREQAVSDIARKLKNLATKIKVPVIAGSQVNDDGKLRESRAIKQHSNQVIYIKHKDDKSCIFVDKNRRGPRNYQFPITMNGEISKLIET